MVLRALLAFYHHMSHMKKGAVNIAKYSPTAFKEFRKKAYDPSKPIVPWSLMTNTNEGLSNWNKLNRPNAKDFKPFREVSQWYEYKESIQITLESQGLSHLVDDKFAIVDKDLDEAQRKFLYKAFKDCFIHHEAKSIVKAHKEDKDTRKIWKEVCNFYDDSITMSIQADILMSHISDVKLRK